MPSTSRYTLTSITADYFTDMEMAWQILLSNSHADPLFNSWQWMHTWWQLYGNGENDALRIVIAKNSDGELLGIAPLYLAKARGPGRFTISTLQFLGTRFGGPAGYRSECLEFILHSQHSDIAEAFTDYIKTYVSTDLIFLSDLILNSATACAFRQSFGYIHSDGPNLTYSVATNGDFDSYIKGLGKNTRLRAFNRRKLLETQDTVTVRRATRDDIELVFNTLERYHPGRWNANVNTNKHRQFIQRLTESDAIHFDGVLICANDHPLAAALDLVAQRRRYNIQLGFDPSYHKKLSLGLLALTYATEQCFLDDCAYYDFLTGTGKNADYKAHIAATEREFSTLHIPVSFFLRVLYQSKALARKLLGRD